MDDFCQYNLFRKPRPPLFIPPPYARTSETKGDRQQIPSLHLRASDPSKILLLCESLKDTCTLDLQFKINHYLISETTCEVAFIASCRIFPDAITISMISYQPLNPRLQISSSDQVIANILQNKSGEIFPVQNLPAAILEPLQTIMPKLAGEVQAIPIYEQKHHHGISEETNFVAHIVFIINSSLPKMFVGHLVQECFRFVQPILVNTTLLEKHYKVKNNYQNLLKIFENDLDLIENKQKMIEIFIAQAKNIFECERCDIYILDKKGKTFEGNVYCNGKVMHDTVQRGEGLLGYVFANKKVINVSDAYQNPMFMKSDDRKCNYKTRNIYCVPIMNHQKVLGCMQLRNKNNGEFNIYDDDIVKFYAPLISFGIQVSDLLNRRKDEMDRYNISTKILLYPYKFDHLDAEHLVHAVRHSIHGFDIPTFNARTIPKHRMGLLVMKMFEDLGFIKTFKFERLILAKFIVLVEKGYFNKPYHNFSHAFSATHFIYSTIIALELMSKHVLSELEVLALLIAALCHDLDHKGKSNCFKSLNNSTLASLYTSDDSLMESYHFSQAINVLNSEDCNFLQSLPKHDYATVLESIKYNILATDYATHLRKFKEQEATLGKNFQPRLREHRMHFCALLMTCADLCEQIRDWRTVRTVALEMYGEFFKTGQLEEQMSIVMTHDRENEKGKIPILHINFLKDVCLPPFQLLARVYTDMDFCVEALYDNITNWELSKSYFFNRDIQEVTSVELLRGHALSMANLNTGEEEEEDEHKGESYQALID